MDTRYHGRRMRPLALLTRVAPATLRTTARSLCLVGALTGLSLGAAPLGLVQEASEQDDARAAAVLLVERCASCHGPDSEQPKAVRGWADAGDLPATFADGELIVPGDPDSSDVFISIEDMAMPPDDSDVPQLNAEEQALIARWIRAGAALPMEEVSAAEEGSTAEVVTAEEPAAAVEEPVPEDVAQKPAPEKSWMTQPWPKWIGRFHPTVVHFPIALLVAALVAEVLSKLLKKPELRPAATFCYTLGALGSVPSAAFGWLLAESTSHRGDDLFYHRWVGVAVVAVALLGLRAFYTRPGVRLPLLVLLAALACITGHFGGSLSYGSDWLALPGR